jgi:hypothetical protein
MDTGGRPARRALLRGALAATLGPAVTSEGAAADTPRGRVVLGAGLTFRHQGLDARLTGVEPCRVVEEILR